MCCWSQKTLLSAKTAMFSTTRRSLGTSKCYELLHMINRAKNSCQMTNHTPGMQTNLFFWYKEVTRGRSMIQFFVLYQLIQFKNSCHLPGISQSTPHQNVQFNSFYRNSLFLKKVNDVQGFLLPRLQFKGDFGNSMSI